MELALELIKLCSVGIIAGVFSSLLANRDHRHRRWWELRVSAYQSAIEALSDIVYYLDSHYNAEVEYRKLPEDFQEKIRTFWETAQTRVRRLADSGAFLFSEGANTALQEFMQNDNEQSYIEALDNGLSKSRRCLAELVACSKEDLKLKEGWLLKILP